MSNDPGIYNKSCGFSKNTFISIYSLVHKFAILEKPTIKTNTRIWIQGWKFKKGWTFSSDFKNKIFLMLSRKSNNPFLDKCNNSIRLFLKSYHCMFSFCSKCFILFCSRAWLRKKSQIYMPLKTSVLFCCVR